ncbi:hypothetical protein [Aeromicrobium erythreum]|jgi:hypothetical protein|uniref:Uncharacterized protein n=1 Tax=Aeromicrobium erythreum TaxID=2041 RepID=A0A0U4BB61_9ACTN|nr:hypothetical protein [Aeromicrobium erythreum]ALX05012.1 hypothetical protein AERYTH_10015 [Aeromicrobium erythreum]
MEQIAPWLFGPLGIVLGWWLNQRTLRGSADRQAKEAEEAAARQRVVDTVTLGRDTAGMIRSLLHGIHLKQQYRQAPQGFSEAISEFNRTRDRFRNAVLALRIQGPSWSVEGADRLDVKISLLAELAMIMQKDITAEHMESVNSELPELERLLRDYVATVSQHYNADSSTLPVQPDFEKEGRWQPPDG